MEYNELYHHGVQGMKWGVRRFQNKDGSLTAAGKKRVAEREKMSPEKKKEIAKKVAIGTAIVGATVATAVYMKRHPEIMEKVNNSINNLRHKNVNDLSGDSISKGKRYVGDFINQQKTNPTGIPRRLSKAENMSEAIHKVNPNVGNREYTNNCTLTSTGVLLRSVFGLDVTAGKTGGKQQLLAGILEDCISDVKILDGSAVKFGKSPKDAEEFLLKRFGNNAKGAVSVQWKSGLGGHAFNFDIENGIVKFLDGQKAKTDSDIRRDFWKMIDPNESLTVVGLTENSKVKIENLKKYFEF